MKWVIIHRRLISPRNLQIKVMIIKYNKMLEMKLACVKYFDMIININKQKEC